LLILVPKEPKESELRGKRRSELLRVKSLDIFVRHTRGVRIYFELLTEFCRFKGCQETMN
jgi:hypothetical protein